MSAVMFEGINSLELMHVEFDDAHNIVLDFDSKTSQRSFFNRWVLAVFTEESITPVVGYDLSKVKINGNYNALLGANYARITQTTGETTQEYYAFIKDMSIAGVGVVALTLDIDYWQSFMFDWEQGPAYIKRGHVDRFYARNMGVLGLSIEPFPNFFQTQEPIDAGNVRELKYTELSYPPITWIYFVSSAPLWGTSDGDSFGYIKNSFFTYAYPFIDNPDSGENSVLIKNSAGVELFEIGVYKFPLEKFSQDATALAIFASKIPPASFSYEKIRNAEDTKTTHVLKAEDDRLSMDLLTVDPAVPALKIIRIKEFFEGFRKITYGTPWIDPAVDFSKMYFPKFGNLTNKNQAFPYDLIFEPKLYSSQFYDDKLVVDGVTVFEFDPVTANPAVSGYLMPGEKKVVCAGYLGANPVWVLADENQKTDPRSVSYNVSNILQFDVVGDQYAEFMRSGWNSEKAGLRVNQLTYEEKKAEFQRNLAPIVGGGGFLNPWKWVNDKRALDNFKSNYENLFEAKIADIKAAPDQIKVAGGTPITDMMINRAGVFIVTGLPPSETIMRIESMLGRYGYTINMYDSDGSFPLKSRRLFNYIQTDGIVILGEKINNKIKNEIRMIFDSGTTIFHVRDDNLLSWQWTDMVFDWKKNIENNVYREWEAWKAE